MREALLNDLLQEKLVVIIRVSSADDIPAIVESLEDGGVRVVEITSNTPGCMEAIASLRESRPALLIGAGTITTPKLARQAIESGAQFLVTPNTRADVVEVAHAAGVPVIMGALTPSEVATATEAGADIIKLFPADSLGPGYLRALARGPFLDTPFFAVGGVDENNLSEWLASGACGAGIGGKLARPVSSPEEAQSLTERAAQIVDILKSGR